MGSYVSGLKQIFDSYYESLWDYHWEEGEKNIKCLGEFCSWFITLSRYTLFYEKLIHASGTRLS